MEDEVVISGVGGHFPECDNLQEYREKLLQNLHLISDGTGELQPRYGGESTGCEEAVHAALDKENLRSGKMRYGDKFDNTFFGMHSRLAAATDAITRHVLETTLEAVLDAGYSPKDLHGTNTAVFMGYHCSESESNFIRESADGFGIMGLNAAMTANRVSYWLDLKGTSFTHSTQLVSGMQGLDMAFRALSRGECDRALVGAASLSYLAELAVHYDNLGWLSVSGSCKPFDKAADGSVRSEAVVVMLLERRSTAQRVYAEVVHTASAIYAEMSRAELPCLERRVISSVLHNFYNECGVHPDEIEYVEADGWGVRSVDEAEVGALDDVIACRRSRPLLLGSVKGNIGQVEAASGLASICKVLIAFESGTIPATINHANANPQIAALQHKRLQVVTENTPLVPGLVAVNNLGLGGIVGHVLLRPNKRVKPSPPPPLPAPAAPEADAETAPSDGSIPKLLLLSGRTPEGLEEVIKMAEGNAHDPEYVHLVHGAFSSHIFGHMYRGYTVVPKSSPESQPSQVKFYTGQKRPVWFIYSGMGSQWAGMGEDLMRIPVFATAVERCHNALVPLGVDLKHIITTKDPKIYDNILHSFVGIAAVQVGLTEVLKAVGVEPTGIIGHSVGELGCAYADGCITAEQMILAAHARGQASNEAELIPGMMAAVGMGYKDIKDMLPESIEVACHNSATSCTLSGPTDDMNRFVDDLKAKGIFARAVNVANIAYHSRYIRPAAPRLLELLKGVITDPKPRSSRWVSTSVKPAQQTPESGFASAEYFTNNLLSSVYFEEGCEQVDKDALAIEIAPHGLLQAILKKSLHQDAVNVAMTKRDQPGTSMVLDSLGKLYMEGLNPQVAKLYPSVETPVTRGTAVLSPLATWDHRDSWPVAFLKAPAESGPRTELHLPLALTTAEFAHLSECTWNGHSVLTPATCLNLILIIVYSFSPEDKPIVFDDVVFEDPVVVPPEGDDEVYAFVQRGSGNFEVSAAGRVLARGRVTSVIDLDRDRYGLDLPPPTVPREERVVHDSEYVYEELGRRGLCCWGDFRSLLQVQQGARAALGTVVEKTERSQQFESLLQVVILQCSESRHELHLPQRIQRLIIDPTKALPAGSDAALQLDVARRSVSLATSTGRVEALQITTQPVPLPPRFAPVLVQAKTFVAFGETEATKDLLQLASLSLQVAVHQGRVPLHVTVADGPGAPRSALLESVLVAADQQLPDLHVRVSPLGTGGDNASLVVSGAADLPSALAAVRRQRGLLLAELPAGFAPPAELRELLSFGGAAAGPRYALLKHVVEVDAASEVLHVMGDSDVPVERLSLCQGTVVYVVFRGVDIPRVPVVLRSVFAAPGGNRAHCLFLDASAPPFALDAPPYAAQLALGLRANVLHKSRWGGVHRAHLAHLTSNNPGCGRMSRTRQLVMPGFTVQYLGVNPYSEDAEDARTAVGLLDYAARRADGQRVMGVCASSAGPLQPDPVLVWPVPQGWSDEDAATVPLAYATAIYALHNQLDVRPGEKALVVGGATALGQAAVALLQALGCRVIVSVADERQKAELRARFAHVEVLTGTVEQFSKELCCRMRTSQCVDLALVQGGPSEIRGTMHILSRYGRAVHVGADHSVVRQALGMSSFLMSTAVYSLSWSWPLKAREDAKVRVRDTLVEAIQKGGVRPLPRQTAPPQALADSQRRVVEGAGKVLLSMKSEPQPAKASSLLDPGHSCLVLGGPAARAVSVSEWMLSAGARNVSVALAGRAVGSGWLARRLGLLANHYSASVRALPAADPQQLVKAASQAGPLGLIMVLEQGTGRVRALDAASRTPGCTLAVLASQTAPPHELLELSDLVRCRREQGYPGVLAALGDLGPDVRVVPLHQIIRAASNPSFHSVEVVQMTHSDDISASESGTAALPDFLPNSVEALRRLGLSLRDTVTQRVLPSLIGGQIDRRNKEVPPVFLVGGLSDSANRELGPIAHYLMATAVVVSPPLSASSVAEAAEAVVAAVVRAQPRGPYTLAGRGWGGCVALEAGRAISKRQGCYVTVFLLDASPDAIQAALLPLHNQPSGLETSLLKYLLKLDREVEQQVYRAPTLAAKVERALGGQDEPLQVALGCVLRRVKALLDYQPTGPVNPKVAVSLVSSHRYHLSAGTLAEVSSDVRVQKLRALEDVGFEAVCKECATFMSSGVHVGRTNMVERRALASLNVSF